MSQPTTTTHPDSKPDNVEHREAGAWKDDTIRGGCGAECACGFTYDGFDSLADAAAMLHQHILDEAPAELREEYEQRELDQDRIPDATGFAEWLTRRNATAEPAEAESERPVKPAADLRVGDHIFDDRGGDPVEVTHVQPYRNIDGDRVLVVNSGAGVRHWAPHQEVALATEDEVAQAQARRDRAQAIADIEAFAEWLRAHPDVPAPTNVNARYATPAQIRKAGDDAKREWIAQMAAVFDVEPVESYGTVRAEFEFRDYTGPVLIDYTASTSVEPRAETEATGASS